MVQKSKVSVIIGTYNRAHLLPRCLDSVFNQTHKNLEVIVVNDASIDNTIEVLELYKRRFGNKFIYINSEINRGIAFNSNLAFKHSKGEYLALIGDDDEWIDRFKLEKQILSFINNNIKLGVVGTWWMDIDISGVQRYHKPEEPQNWKRRLLSGGGIICGSTAMISREAWNFVGGFDERMPRGTDSDLFRNIVISGYKGKIIQEITTVVDIGHGKERMTPLNNITALKKENEALRIILNKYSKNFNEYKRIKLRRLFKYYKNLLSIYKLKVQKSWTK